MHETKTYIVEIPEVLGEDTSIRLEADGETVKSLFSIVVVSPAGAGVVDNGYRSVEEAHTAWPEAIRPKPYDLTPSAIDENYTIRAEQPTRKLT